MQKAHQTTFKVPPESPSSVPLDRSEWPVRKGRVGDREPRADVSHLTPSQRVKLCWEVTKQAWALTGAALDESAFCRDSERVSRGIELQWFGLLPDSVLGTATIWLRIRLITGGKGSPDIYCPAQFLRGDMNTRENRSWRFLIEAECAPADLRS